ncbi:MAG TPA: hypothetical protein GXX17_06690 [Clostridiales bacterium]|nr:hypothetical protein [Clostridiales bacterium]
MSALFVFPIHELIHAFFWGISTKQGFKAVRFGFIMQYLTPYRSCMEPLSLF